MVAMKIVIVATNDDDDDDDDDYRINEQSIAENASFTCSSGLIRAHYHNPLSEHDNPLPDALILCRGWL